MITDPNDAANDAGRDATLAAVADGRRRIVLRTLARADAAELDVATLADRVAERVPRNDGADEHRFGVHSSLHHVHLPKLAASGLIEFDAESGRVRRRPDDLAEEFLTVVDEAASAD